MNYTEGKIRLRVANHPEFIPTLEQIEIGLKDKSYKVKDSYEKTFNKRIKELVGLIYNFQNSKNDKVRFKLQFIHNFNPLEQIKVWLKDKSLKVREIYELQKD